MEAVQAAQVKPQVVIQSSGIGYYGTRDDSVLTEKDGAGDDFLARLTVEHGRRRPRRLRSWGCGMSVSVRAWC